MRKATKGQDVLSKEERLNLKEDKLERKTRRSVKKAIQEAKAKRKEEESAEHPMSDLAEGEFWYLVKLRKMIMVEGEKKKHFHQLEWTPAFNGPDAIRRVGWEHHDNAVDGMSKVFPTCTGRKRGKVRDPGELKKIRQDNAAVARAARVAKKMAKQEEGIC